MVDYQAYLLLLAFFLVVVIYFLANRVKGNNIAEPKKFKWFRKLKRVNKTKHQDLVDDISRSENNNVKQASQEEVQQYTQDSQSTKDNFFSHKTSQVSEINNAPISDREVSDDKLNKIKTSKPIYNPVAYEINPHLKRQSHNKDLLDPNSKEPLESDVLTLIPTENKSKLAPKILDLHFYFSNANLTSATLKKHFIKHGLYELMDGTFAKLNKYNSTLFRIVNAFEPSNFKKSDVQLKGIIAFVKLPISHNAVAATKEMVDYIRQLNADFTGKIYKNKNILANEKHIQKLFKEAEEYSK